MVCERNNCSYPEQQRISAKPLHKRRLNCCNRKSGGSRVGHGWAISRDTVTFVTWNTEAGNVQCSCNKLVYRGMPCSHIIHVAEEEKRKIPLQCFNHRFLCQQREKDSTDETQDGSPLVSAPATEEDCTQVEDLHHPATHSLRPGCENIWVCCVIQNTKCLHANALFLFYFTFPA